MNIEKLSAGTVSGACYCEKLCLPGEAWSEADIAAMTDREGGLYFVALEDGNVAGTAGALAVCGEAQLTNLAVLPAYRRRGLARGLLERLLRGAASLGCTRAVLEVAETNTGALALYTGAGFAVCGRRRGFYRGTDALICEKNLLAEK